MRKNKIGSLFFIFVLALAGIGISYAGFTDKITVYGTVDTATVDLEVKEYSCTYVWKIYNFIPNWVPPPEILVLMQQGRVQLDQSKEYLVYSGPVIDPQTIEALFTGPSLCTIELISYAKAIPGSKHGDKLYDVDTVWNNIFPCIDFTADVIVQYTGGIPAHVSWTNPNWVAGEGYYDFSQYTTFKVYSYSLVDDEWVKGAEITKLPVQMHTGEYIGIVVTIHIPQLNDLQGKHGEFSFDVTALQWNDECNPPTTGGKTFTLPEYSITAQYWHQPWHMPGYGNPSYWDIVISGVNENTYNLKNGWYDAWCVDEFHYMNDGQTVNGIQAWSSLSFDDPSFPWLGNNNGPVGHEGYDWPCVNYILNHKGSYNLYQIQSAIWYFVDGGYWPSDSGAQALTQSALDNVVAWYNDFPKSEPGYSIVAVLLFDPALHQQCIIEVDP